MNTRNACRAFSDAWAAIKLPVVIYWDLVNKSQYTHHQGTDGTWLVRDYKLQVAVRGLPTEKAALDWIAAEEFEARK